MDVQIYYSIVLWFGKLFKSIDNCVKKYYTLERDLSKNVMKQKDKFNNIIHCYNYSRD